MNEKKLIILQDQGSFTVGGKTIRDEGVFDPHYIPNPFDGIDNPENRKPTGQSFSGDHAYVFYQIPERPHKNPLVFLHGASMSGSTWETTPDGRDGFQNIFLRKDYSVYLVDQPRRGRAGASTVPCTIPVVYTNEAQFNLGRFGIWPEPYKDAAFPNDEDTIDQLRRMGTPNTGPFDPDLVADAMGSLFDRIGGGVLISHSQGGGSGWKTAFRTDKLRAIISLEPGTGFVFPEGEVPEALEGLAVWTSISGIPVKMEEFMKLTRIPIYIIYGDMIPKERIDDLGRDQWYIRVIMARKFVDCINRHGGDASLLMLPDVGIYGNTHMLMSDLNNQQVADVMDDWMKSKGLL